MLPLKYLDFIESPVPILTGLVVDSEGTDLSPEYLLGRCDDQYCSGMTAVLDTSACETYMLAKHAAAVPDLLMPGGEALMASLREGPIAGEVSSRLSYQKSSGLRRPSVVNKLGKAIRPAYTVTDACRQEATALQVR